MKGTNTIIKEFAEQLEHYSADEVELADMVAESMDGFDDHVEELLLEKIISKRTFSELMSLYNDDKIVDLLKDKLDLT